MFYSLWELNWELSDLPSAEAAGDAETLIRSPVTSRVTWNKTNVSSVRKLAQFLLLDYDCAGFDLLVLMSVTPLGDIWDHLTQIFQPQNNHKLYSSCHQLSYQDSIHLSLSLRNSSPLSPDTDLIIPSPRFSIFL